MIGLAALCTWAQPTPVEAPASEQLQLDGGRVDYRRGAPSMRWDLINDLAP